MTTMNEEIESIPIWGRKGEYFPFKIFEDLDYVESIKKNGFMPINSNGYNLIQQEDESQSFSISEYHNKGSDISYIDVWGPYSQIATFVTCDEWDKFECLQAISSLLYNLKMISHSCHKEERDCRKDMEQK
jgi:hypothetical protein